jgi:queuine tRNA-ribosyltransferase
VPKKFEKFSFNLENTKGKARAGSFTTAHGVVQTPMFMPVGTQGVVKSLDSQDLKSLQAQIILGNTYHLYLRPNIEMLRQAGGLHKYMKWSGPILTDSGGYQVFSLSANSKITEEGVNFTSHLDGSKHFFTPEKSLEIQRAIGADIIMNFDECTPDAADPKYAREALERTHRWAKQCKVDWEKNNRQSDYGTYQALFGIVQGGMHRELRVESAEFMVDVGFDGYAVGGETIGYNPQGTSDVMSWIEDILPADAPRYAMGMGLGPFDVVQAVLLGFDMFDCVGPTRIARNGNLFYGHLDVSGAEPKFVSEFKKGRISIGRSEYATDHQPIQADCDCHTCAQGYSRAYLRHLYKTKELSYYRLASIHNLRFMVRLNEQLREWILAK